MAKAQMKPVPDGWLVAPYKGQHMAVRVTVSAMGNPIELKPVTETPKTIRIKLFRYRWQAIEFIEAAEHFKQAQASEGVTHG